MRQEDFKRRAMPVLYPVTPQSTDLEPPCSWAISLSTSQGLVLKFYRKPLIWLIKIFQDFKLLLIAPQSCHPEHSQVHQEVRKTQVFMSSFQYRTGPQASPAPPANVPRVFSSLLHKFMKQTAAQRWIFLSCRRNL